jgi:hypothetical protein
VLLLICDWESHLFCGAEWLKEYITTSLLNYILCDEGVRVVASNVIGIIVVLYVYNYHDYKMS